MLDPNEALPEALASHGDSAQDQYTGSDITANCFGSSESVEDHFTKGSEGTAQESQEVTEQYQVGFGRPPKHGQFRPGISGNPLGRPKGSKNFLTRFNEVTSSLVTVTENGKTKTMPLMEAIIYKEAHRALANSRAAHQVFKMEMMFEAIEQPTVEKALRHEGEKKAIRSLLARIQKTQLLDSAGSE